MKQSNSVLRGWVLVTLLAGLLLVSGTAMGQAPTAPTGNVARRTPTGTTATKRTPPRTAKRESTAAIKQDVADAIELIKQNYIGGNSLNYNEVFKSSIEGMLRTLDPHSSYFDPAEFEELRNDQHSEYSGIGASIVNQAEGDELDTYITATFEGSPAARAGLRFGDRIAKVDGEDMHGRPSSDVRDKIRGPKGSSVKMTIERASDGRTDLVTLVRNMVPQPSVPDAYIIRDGVGYVDMTRGFNWDTADNMRAALEYLHGRGMTSLILDLRGNPGGFLDQAVEVASRFLQPGQLVLSQKGRTPNSAREWRVSGRGSEAIPLVILVNGNTASASEIVSGAVQDHDRGLIVGQTTFGKGLVQTIIPLDFGAGLTLTSAKYYTPSGRLIQRDYSRGDIYDYYTRGGIGSPEEEAAKPTGPASRTDAGREVYGGNGIAPDIAVKPQVITGDQARLADPLFFFSRELANGRVAGFESSKLGTVDFGHRVQPTEFPVTDALYQKFAEFAGRKPEWKAAIEHAKDARDFVTLQLRFNLAMAAYGSITASQVLIDTDPQVKAAMGSLPRARELAQNAGRATTPRIVP
jgi:carboxyl-terminal processing protease